MSIQWPSILISKSSTGASEKYLMVHHTTQLRRKRNKYGAGTFPFIVYQRPYKCYKLNLKYVFLLISLQHGCNAPVLMKNCPINGLFLVQKGAFSVWKGHFGAKNVVQFQILGVWDHPFTLKKFYAPVLSVPWRRPCIELCVFSKLVCPPPPLKVRKPNAIFLV